MTAPPPEIAILIVTYNNAKTIEPCLTSLSCAAQHINHSIDVWDNGSSDKTTDVVRGVSTDITLHQSPKNIGFGAAVNRIAHGKETPFLLVLNPDTVVSPDALTSILDAAKLHPDAAIFGGQAYGQGGQPLAASRQRMLTVASTWLRTFGLARLLPWVDHELRHRAPLKSVARSDLIEGSFMLVRREVWERLEGFDERFFLYGEDLDLCARAAERGVLSMTQPAAKYTHIVGASSSNPTKKTAYILSARAELARRYRRPIQSHAIILGLLTGVFLRTQIARAIAVKTNWRAIWDRRHIWTQRPLLPADLI